MGRPTRFYVEYMEPTFWEAVDRGDADPDDWDPSDVEEEDFETLEAAVERARSPELDGLGPRVCERLDLEPHRDPERPRTIIHWDWQQRIVTDEPHEWRPGDPPVYDEEPDRA